ncbi:hypothetical protein MRX96_006039 [Rhipicephalus microplus]
MDQLRRKLFISCLVNVEVEEPGVHSELRATCVRPPSSPLLLLRGLIPTLDIRKPQSDHEYDDEDEEDEQRSSDDEDMPAHRPRITGFIGSKVAFKRQAVRPGNQADLARNRKLCLEVSQSTPPYHCRAVNH